MKNKNKKQITPDEQIFEVLLENVKNQQNGKSEQNN